MTDTMVVTVQQAAEESGLTKYRIRELLHSDQIRYVKCGKKYMINMQSLMEYCNGGNMDRK